MDKQYPVLIGCEIMKDIYHVSTMERKVCPGIANSGAPRIDYVSLFLLELTTKLSERYDWIAEISLL